MKMATLSLFAFCLMTVNVAFAETKPIPAVVDGGCTHMADLNVCKFENGQLKTQLDVCLAAKDKCEKDLAAKAPAAAKPSKPAKPYVRRWLTRDEINKLVEEKLAGLPKTDPNCCTPPSQVDIDAIVTNVLAHLPAPSAPSLPREITDAEIDRIVALVLEKMPKQEAVRFGSGFNLAVGPSFTRLFGMKSGESAATAASALLQLQFRMGPQTEFTLEGAWAPAGDQAVTARGAVTHYFETFFKSTTGMEFGLMYQGIGIERNYARHQYILGSLGVTWRHDWEHVTSRMNLSVMGGVNGFDPKHFVPATGVMITSTIGLRLWK